jgi:hypothetical protein
MLDGDRGDLMTAMAIEQLAIEQLAVVAGGVANDDALGRCGPGTRWRWLGDVSTPECRDHDIAVRSRIAAGTPRWRAHLEALPQLPAAVDSYVRARLR